MVIVHSKIFASAGAGAAALFAGLMPTSNCHPMLPPGCGVDSQKLAPQTPMSVLRVSFECPTYRCFDPLQPTRACGFIGKTLVRPSKNTHMQQKQSSTIYGASLLMIRAL